MLQLICFLAQEPIWQDLFYLEALTQKIKEDRFSKGSLKLFRSKLRLDEFDVKNYSEFNLKKYSGNSNGRMDFKKLLDSLNGWIDVTPKGGRYALDESSAHSIVEELMLLANKTVAVKLSSSTMSHLSVLRFHPKPNSEKLEELSVYLKYVV